MDGFVGGVAQGTADADRVVVTQIPADFTDDHRNRIGRELYAQCRIEVVDGFDQTDASNLKEIIYVLVVPGKALDYT